MENTTAKLRSPSRCREWERQRRNRFNEAITKLGQVVKEIIKNDTKSESVDNVQYPKIEIVQKAILCLTTYAQEKTQLKAEILSLQVKLEAERNHKPDKKDASIQVSAMLCRKNKNGKYVKLVMLQKSKKNILKDEPAVTTNDVPNEKTESKPVQENCATNKTAQKLPKLLPLTNNINAKKGIENALVMFSGTPYMFPHRPLLFPAVPPAIVFLDPNIQNINKPSTIPIINRNNGDMTKTTMVNILPISAYTHSMSDSKQKKNSSKTKQTQKKPIKKVTKSVSNAPKEIVKVSKEIKLVTENNSKSETSKDPEKEEILRPEKDINSNNESNKTHGTENTTFNDQQPSESEITKNARRDLTNKEIRSDKSKISQANPDNGTIPIITSVIRKSDEIQNLELNEVDQENPSKSDKISMNKNMLLDDKDKENKLPNILDTSLCDNVVDGGNARLELAEEFLAASPTAAFLMSFPLVSGNRADSPAEENHNNIHSNAKSIHGNVDNSQRRNDVPPSQPLYFSKSDDIKAKTSKSSQQITNITQKQSEHQKFINNINIPKESKITNISAITNSSNDNPFLNLSMPSIIPTSCTFTDSAFSLDFDCNVSKANQPVSVVSNNNFFYKSDPLNTTKSTIYSTSNISSGHEFNSIGLYPCAMDKFSTKNKSDFPNMEDNLIKIGPSRLTYDIDLGWSHKGFDFVACSTNSSTFNKDNILSTAPTQYSTSYNPFNPEFHVPLVTNTNKKDNVSSKAITSFPETITSFYSQPTNLWSDEMTFYSSNNFSKNLSTKPQTFTSLNSQPNANVKNPAVKQFETKHISNIVNHINKPIIEGLPIIPDKYTKKSPSKMHINWMTSEIRPMQNNCNPNQATVKENQKTLYPQHNIVPKKQDNTDGNYFPINMHNFPSQVAQEEFQVWPTARPAGTTEISIEPPPINLPTLVGDLALGPEKKKNETVNRALPQPDPQNCNNFLSVTQLMNRPSDVNLPSRYQGPVMEPKINPKQNLSNMGSDSRKSRLETNLSQPCYVFNEPKAMNYEPIGQFSHTKSKSNKPDKSSKNQKTSYSAEALIRGGPCNQKTQDTTITKFMLPTQKFNDFNVAQDSGVAQVSHFPPLLNEYPDNGYTGQQFSGTTLYNSTANTISNSFYSNFMPSSGNLMSSNYTSGPFQSEFIDYNQPAAECNYTNYKYEDLKMKVNSTPLLQEKPSLPQYKGSRRDTAAKHKLEYSKKESSKKCNSKRAKLANEAEEWSDTSHLHWQNKTPNKKHPNISHPDDLTFHNYVGNQISAGSQYQPEFFNGHLMPSNMQNVNIERTFTSLPPTSRANFNLSTIFPEITMKVQ